ncbi:MAG: hypothetical protein R3D63_05080 [Paracoccaceae bacterium]
MRPSRPSRIQTPAQTPAKSPARTPALTLAAALVALALPAAPVQAADLPGSKFASGNWAGAAWVDDRGAFVDCYFGVRFSGGEELSVSLTADDTLTVYLTAPGAKFAPGASYDAALMTESGYPITGKGFGSNETFIGFPIAGVDAAIDFLTQGSSLRLYGVGIDQSLDIRGIGGALSLARACLVTQGSAAQTAAAPAPAAAAPAPAKPKLGSGLGAKPAQMSGDTAVFSRLPRP